MAAMKFLLVVTLTATLAAAEPTRYRHSSHHGPAFRTFANQEDHSHDFDDSYGAPPNDVDSESGPYPPSGWRPSGELLLLPGESLRGGYNNNGGSYASNGYGSPANTNGGQGGNGQHGQNTFGNGNGQSSTPNTYGPPNNQSGTQNGQDTSTTKKPSVGGTSEELKSEDKDSDKGQYYVLLPDGKLQRVQYSGQKQERGKYIAQVQYEIVEPVRSPVYSYQGVSLTK